VTVEVGQAGGRVACSACNQQLDVPTLRNLRHLPLAEKETIRPRETTWNVRKGFVTVGLILASLLAGYALWNRLTEPRIPKFDAEQQLKMVNENLEKMSPVDVWNRWIGVYQSLPSTGFRVFEYQNADTLQREIDNRRILQTALLITAALIAAASLALALFSSKQTRRQVDNKIRR
jgi:hypothetical protein